MVTGWGLDGGGLTGIYGGAGLAVLRLRGNVWGGNGVVGGL